MKEPPPQKKKFDKKEQRSFNKDFGATGSVLADVILHMRVKTVKQNVNLWHIHFG